MSDPEPKSLQVPFLLRQRTIWQSPGWLMANQWRQFVYNQPLAMICRSRLINHIQEMPFDIVVRDDKQKEVLEPDCNYYKNWVFRDFDNWVDKHIQDTLDLPMGGNSEVSRWPIGVMPIIQNGDEEYKVTRDNPRGHVFELINIDGASLYPTWFKDAPIAQRFPESLETVYFTEDQIARTLIQPRTELLLKGYGKPPPEQIFLSMQMVHYADHYYSDLLRNVPPVGILDLIDMSQDTAIQWSVSAMALFEGSDAFKMPLLYEHTKVAEFIPFGKSPQEMMFDVTSLKYARQVVADYGLTLGNLGLEPKGETLAGSIRDDRQASTGYGMLEEKIKGMIDQWVLPSYLEFIWVKQDWENVTGMARAFLVRVQGLKFAKEAGFIKPSEGQAQLVKDGFFTVELEKPNDEKLALAQQPMNGFQNGKDVKQLEDKKAPSEGGKGDVTAQ